VEIVMYAESGRVLSNNKSPWILAVEDSATDMYLLQRVLDETPKPPQIIQARDGERAIQLLRDLAANHEILPDLIVIDLNLPRVDGYQVLAHLRSNDAFQEIPIVAVTSSQAEGDRKRALAGGADAYFVKPMDIASYRQLPGAMDDARRVRLTKLTPFPQGN